MTKPAEYMPGEGPACARLAGCRFASLAELRLASAASPRSSVRERQIGQVSRAYVNSMTPLVGETYATDSGRAFDRMRAALVFLFSVAALFVVATSAGPAMLLEFPLLFGWFALYAAAVALLVYRATQWFAVWTRLRSELRAAGLKVRRAPDLRGPTLFESWARLEGLSISTIAATIEPQNVSTQSKPR